MPKKRVEELMLLIIQITLTQLIIKRIIEVRNGVNTAAASTLMITVTVN